MTNLMAFHRSTIEAFDEWASVVGDSSYTWANLLPYYKKSAKYLPADANLRAANASVPALSVGSYSTFGGPIEVTYPNFAYPGASYAGPAFEELGIHELNDLQSGQLLGWQSSPFAITKNMERSGATSFLQYATDSGRKNLKLYTTTMAKKVIFNSNHEATGVQVETNGMAYILGVKKEVIISAGVVSTQSQANSMS